MAHVHAIYEPGRSHVQRLKEDLRVHREDDDEGDGGPPTPARSS